MRHPSEMGAQEVERFLNHLAVQQRVAAATQNQALSALLYLYRKVLGVELPWLEGLERARRSRRLPTVLSRREVGALLPQFSHPLDLIAQLLYGSGLRLLECMRLRVKDLDFDGCVLVVREGKGDRDRQTLLPEPLHDVLRRHLDVVRGQWQSDRPPVWWTAGLGCRSSVEVALELGGAHVAQSRVSTTTVVEHLDVFLNG
jgi:site-specific recombinase XerD